MELLDNSRVLLFPFLFGGTFIEGSISSGCLLSTAYFPSFSEGLSLRDSSRPSTGRDLHPDFPSFSEGLSLRAPWRAPRNRRQCYFPSFSEGLSLRVSVC